MTLPPNKTKIVCTIGPASESPVARRARRAECPIHRLGWHPEVRGWRG